MSLDGLVKQDKQSMHFTMIASLYREQNSVSNHVSIRCAGDDSLSVCVLFRRCKLQRDRRRSCADMSSLPALGASGRSSGSCWPSASSPLWQLMCAWTASRCDLHAFFLFPAILAGLHLKKIQLLEAAHHMREYLGPSGCLRMSR